MQITLSVKNTPIYNYFQQLPWKNRLVYTLAGCALAFLLFKKIFSHYIKNTQPSYTPALTEELSPTSSGQHPKNPLSSFHFLKFLGISLQELAKYGIKSDRDLKCLNIFFFDEQIIETIKEIVILMRSPRREYAFLERGTVVHKIEMHKLEKDYQVIEGIHEKLTNFINFFKIQHQFIQAISSSCIPPEFEFFQDIQNTQDSLDTLSAQCCLQSPNEQGDAKGLETLKKISLQIIRINIKRKIYWLKKYLIQERLIEFWNREQPDEKARSLHDYFVKTNRSGWDGYRMNS